MIKFDNFLILAKNDNNIFGFTDYCFFFKQYLQLLNLYYYEFNITEYNYYTLIRCNNTYMMINKINNKSYNEPLIITINLITIVGLF